MPISQLTVRVRNAACTASMETMETTTATAAPSAAIFLMMTRLAEQARQDWKRHLRQVWPGCDFGMHRQSVGSLFGLIVCVIDMRTWTVQRGRQSRRGGGHLAVAFPFLIKVHSSLNFSWQFNRDIITPRQLEAAALRIMLNASANGS